MNGEWLLTGQLLITLPLLISFFIDKHLSHFQFSFHKHGCRTCEQLKEFLLDNSVPIFGRVQEPYCETFQTYSKVESISNPMCLFPRFILPYTRFVYPFLLVMFCCWNVSKQIPDIISSSSKCFNMQFKKKYSNIFLHNHNTIIMPYKIQNFFNIIQLPSHIQISSIA